MTYGELKKGSKVKGLEVVSVKTITDRPSMVRVTYASGWIEARGKQDKV